MRAISWAIKEPCEQYELVTPELFYNELNKSEKNWRPWEPSSHQRKTLQISEEEDYTEPYSAG